jgi:serine/threonine-protein kinase HipA
VAELSALVWKNSIPAATLETEGSRVTFQYLPEYLTTNGPAIAWSLPLSDQPIVFENGAVPAFFAGLLPEGRRLNAIAKRLKTSADNELALLLALGADGIGDAQVTAIDSRELKRDVLLLPKDTTTVSFKELQARYFDSPASGLPGFQDKVSSKMLNAPAKKQGLEYIIKFNPQEAPYAVENEHYFLQLCRRAGLSVANFELLTDVEGEHALLLERFDRVRVDGSIRRLAMEDSCQVLNLYPSQKYDVSFEDVAQALIANCSAQKPAALELFRQLVFNWLIGNGDAHAKNFSILQQPSGEWRISPAYDLLCTLYYQDNEMALSVGGKTKDWDRPLLLELSDSLGLPSLLAQKQIEDLLTKTGNLASELEARALPFRNDENYKVGRALRKRSKRIVG